ncbi:class III lanthionine synthetase LanKC [Streptomyces sp. NPDC001262]|uniref:class III lanthionine synthetase LanKC n=1 Tax=unclassified Streptomyces TaxID=2593676 RepID=UPI0036A6D8AF
MDKRYDVYCMADRHFYDLPENTASEEELREQSFVADGIPLPSGWQKTAMGDWLVCNPPGLQLPDQGWKIHASAHKGNADTVLETVLRYCIPRGISFKYLANRQALFNRNLKYADRGASGKFITIYPLDEEMFQRILEDLAAELEGQEGPYILSDLRWGDGPLYVRYGGFVGRHCLSDTGALVGAIENDRGELVPDRRDPVFRVPEWVELPGFLRPHLEARSKGTADDIGYTVENAVHFSNGGGIYQARDRRTGRKVILKEARPYAGLSADSTDAVTRLRHERHILERLRGIAAVPEVLDYFEWGGHEFLVQEFVEGDTLSKMFAHRCPLNERETSVAEAKSFTEWAVGISRQVEEAVDRIHERGIVFGDLHPFNILVSEDGRVSLIDYEVASEDTENFKPSLVNPAYSAPMDRAGFEHDRYALGCLRLALFLPLTTLLRHDMGKVADFAEEIRRNFPVPPGYLEKAVADIMGVPEREATEFLRTRTGRMPGAGAATTAHLPPLATGPEDWPLLRDSIARAIVRSATPQRDDRLFPGDIEQFHTGGLNLMHGAAGVLLALSDAGCSYPPEFDRWLERRALQPRPEDRLGLYDGRHGVAYALLKLGYADTAEELVGLCLKERWEGLGNDLRSGLAGIGLNLLAFEEATGDADYLRAAQHAAGLVVERLGTEDSVPARSGGTHPYAGLLRGGSGTALFLLHLYERTADSALLVAARTALGQDLRRCVTRDNGMMHVDEGWRTMPYLATGSVGIGPVLDRYLSHRPEEDLIRSSDAIAEAACSQFYVQPNLFNGRAGMILHLAQRAGARPGDERTAHDLAQQVKLLGLHTLPFGGDAAFPGEMLMRLSMDLATGSAGILLALAAAAHDGRVGLPFLTALSVPRGTAS